jgi:hypothetical protein
MKPRNLLLLVAGIVGSIVTLACLACFALGLIGFLVSDSATATRSISRATEAAPPVPSVAEVTPTVPPVTEAAPLPEFIIDAPSILGKPLSEVEPLFGEPEFITPIGADVLESIPQGGEEREYSSEKYNFGLRIDPNGTVRSFFTSGLKSENHSLEQYKDLLMRFNIAPTNPPDGEAPARIWWENSNGYYISITSDGDGPIDIINIWIVE